MARKATKMAPAKAKAKARAAKSAPAPRGKIIKITAQPNKGVTTSALLQTLAEYQGLTKAQAKALTETYLSVVKAYVLKGAKVKIGDLGVVTLRHRKARLGRNPQTGAPIRIKASKKIAFRQTALMREMVASGHQITLTTHGSTGGQKPTD